ncbi:MAG TPA: response regulator [Abditibacteriaceae bacterium]|jgi:two-component system OmpR family response regulator
MAHILVVDDEPSINGLIAMVLKLEGHDVRQAHEGKTALRMAQEITPDLILLDVMMPGMSGFDVAHALFQSPATQRIPIMFVTATPKPEDLDSNPSMPPIVDYVCKPFEIQSLMVQVRRALNGTPQNS